MLQLFIGDVLESGHVHRRHYKLRHILREEQKIRTTHCLVFREGGYLIESDGVESEGNHRILWIYSSYEKRKKQDESSGEEVPLKSATRSCWFAF